MTTVHAEPKLQPRPSPVLVRGADTGAVRRYAWARTVLGLLWALDATLKWLPGFRRQFLAMVQGTAAGQPHWLGWWFRFWPSLVAHSPAGFATLTALAETAIALSLLLGVLQRLGWAFAIVFGVLIWGVGEGFGGPYGSGATDIGTAIVYSIALGVLWLAVPVGIRRAAPALDHRLARVRGLRWATFSA